MADNTDISSFGNFGIEDTMEMGAGSAELLNDLMSPETVSSGADDIEKIVKEVVPPVVIPDAKVKGKEIVQQKEGEELSGQDILKNFLNDAGDDPLEEQTTGKAKENPLSPTEETEKDDTSPFTALAKDLFSLGVFSKEEDEDEVKISTPEEFLDRFNAEKKKGAIEMVNSFISQFGEDYRDAFEAIYVKGVDPKQYFDIYNSVVSFAEMDLSQETNQVKVMQQALTDQGMEAEDISSEIERLKNYGDLESVSAKHHKVLVKKQATKLAQVEQASEAELKQKQAAKASYITNVQNIISEKLKAKEYDGIPLNPKLAGELQDFLLVDKYKTTNGELLTDFDRAILELKRPENHSQKVKVALILKMLEKDPTLSTIQRSGVSKKSDQLFGEVARQKSVEHSSSGKGPLKGSWFS